MNSCSDFEIKMFALEMLIREFILILTADQLKYIQDNLDRTFQKMSIDNSISPDTLIKLRESVNILFLHRP